MNKTEKLAKLRTLQTELDALRRELGVSALGDIIYRADLDVTSDDTVLVEADGFGGATTRIVEGNYPVDYTTKFETFYPTESEAEAAAEELASHKHIPR
jgi:hypothetical protein